jgi:hypothetical protein
MVVGFTTTYVQSVPTVGPETDNITTANILLMVCTKREKKLFENH